MNAASVRGRIRFLAVVVAGVLVATSLWSTGARADPPDKRDVQHIGNPVVLPLTLAQQVNDRLFRQAFGFRSDDAYIKDLYDQVARGALPGASRNWAALLTAEEAADMTRRQQLGAIVGPSPLETDIARLTAFGRYLRSHIGEFSGEYFDQLADGAVVVLVKSSLNEHAAALARILGPLADHLRVVAAAHTYQELTTLTQRLADDSGWLRDHGVVLSAFGPDVPSNTVVAHVPADPKAVEFVLQSRYPGAPLRVIEGPPLRTTGANDTQAPPMMGGLEMWRCDATGCLTAVACSSGFIVSNGSSYAVIGAGHCGGGFNWLQGSPYTLGDYFVGATATSYFGALGDAEVIPLVVQQDASHFVYLSTTSCGFLCTSHNLRVIAGSEASTSVGEVTCASRTQEADEICGNVTAVDQCVTVLPSNTIVCHQVFGNVPTIQGDSGGPFYQPQLSGTSLAQGIICCGDLQTFTSYTQIAAAFAAISFAGGGSWSIY